MNKDELQTAIEDAYYIISDLLDCIETMPISSEDFIGEELCERIREWDYCLE